ncbi:hypothetical protein FBY13_10828 [Pantoea sp. SJZ147]|jgi:hypothetical protein|nr:hypothetical protein FBY13_10828 [Pantoea sp. SJZ147]
MNDLWLKNDRKMISLLLIIQAYPSSAARTLFIPSDRYPPFPCGGEACRTLPASVPLTRVVKTQTGCYLRHISHA